MVGMSDSPMRGPTFNGVEARGDHPQFVVQPVIAGSLKAGGALTVNFCYLPNGPMPQVEYLWQANGWHIGHESILRTIPGNIGRMITCTVTLRTDDWVCAATSEEFGPICDAC